MKSIGLAVCAVLVGAVQSTAQKPDSTNRSAAASSTGGTVNAPTVPTDDGTDAVPRCWLGCKHSLQRTAPAEWGGSTQAHLDSLTSRLDRRSRTLTPASTTASGTTLARAASATTPASATSTGGAAGGQTTAPATEADAERYLIEEWRRSELDMADSVHHVVLARISRLFDSAQRVGSSDERDRVLREVDGINSINQTMWYERRVDVNRRADSLLRAVPGLTSP